jgi:hypothetical protein
MKDVIANIDHSLSRLSSVGDQFSVGDVEAMMRNRDVPSKKWVELIEDLDTTHLPVVFIGRTLRRWRGSSDYERPLKKQLVSRLGLAKSARSNDRADIETYFCLQDAQAVNEWTKFIEDIITTGGLANRRAIRLAEFGVKIGLLAVATPYSAVYCAGRLAVTPYTANRNVDESLSIFFQMDGGPILDLYVRDVMKIARSMT